jgi:internalin A
LARLTALEYLDIHDNQVTDLTPLRGLARLRYLDARQNNLPGLTGLEQLYQLEVLRTGYGGGSMAVNDLRPLKKLLQLHTLELPDCHITDISPILALKKLRHLDLSRNRISGKVRLDGFTEMQTLNLSYNKITILDITLMPKLAELQITDNQLVALPPLSATPAIREIYAGFNNITQISCSRQTVSLAIISLKHNKLQHLGFLQYTPSLKQIDVSSNRISDLRPLLHFKDAQISCRQNPADSALLQDHEQKQLGLRP